MTHKPTVTEHLRNVAENLDILLWARRHLPNNECCGVRWKWEFFPSERYGHLAVEEIQVPMKGHLPDVLHPDWPAAKAELLSVRKALGAEALS